MHLVLVLGDACHRSCSYCYADSRRPAGMTFEVARRAIDLALELKEHYTVVMVTHNMQQAARISDNTAFFLLGELVEFGRTEQLFSAPADKRTEDYITGRFG